MKPRRTKWVYCSHCAVSKYYFQTEPSSNKCNFVNDFSGKILPDNDLFKNCSNIETEQKGKNMKNNFLKIEKFKTLIEAKPRRRR